MSYGVGNNGLVGAQHLLRALGLNVEQMLGKIEDLQDQVGDLQQLSDAFQNFAGGTSPQALTNMLSGGAIPGQGAMARPDQGHCCCAGKYAQPQNFDLGGSAKGSNIFQQLGNRLQGAKFERFLQQNPFARAQAEMMLGGRILPDGMADGRIQVQPFPSGHAPAGGQHSQAASAALGLLDMINKAGMGLQGMPQAHGLPGMGGGQGNPLNGMMQMMMLGALAQMMGLDPSAMGGAQGGQNQKGNQPLYANGGRGDSGGLWNPKKGGYPGEEGSPENVAGILNDPSLTVEDKVTLMLMAIMKKMDKDIEAQAEKINALQQKSGKGGGGEGGAGGAGGAGGKAGGKGSPSIDVETMRLKRLIDKRSQMFDMLRQIVDKYNETAKNVIQSIGR